MSAAAPPLSPGSLIGLLGNTMDVDVPCKRLTSPRLAVRSDWETKVAIIQLLRKRGWYPRPVQRVLKMLP